MTYIFVILETDFPICYIIFESLKKTSVDQIIHVFPQKIMVKYFYFNFS